MSSRRMTFRRLGRAKHLQIRSADDLQNALCLQDELWVAISAPLTSLQADPVLLELLDTDSNGRLFATELRAAIEWTLDVLDYHGGMDTGWDAVRTADVKESHPDAQRIVPSLQKMLTRLGKNDTDPLTIEEIRAIKVEVASQPVSEVGVILPEAAREDQDLQTFIEDVIWTIGPASHPSGKGGLSPANLGRFLASANAYIAWREQGEPATDSGQTDIQPLGSETSDAFGVLSKVRAKLDQYFAQCEAAALDERFVQRMGWTEQELEQLDFDDPAVIEEVLRSAPLAAARSTRELPFDAPMNPYWAPAIESFRREVLPAAFEGTLEKLTSTQWRTVKECFGPYADWLSRKPASAVDSLGLETLRRYASGDYAKRAGALMAESGETAFVLENIRLCEKLVLLQGNLLRLANNFVSFPDLYDPRRRALFEAGSLVMDGRRFNLAVKAENRAEHAQFVRQSNMCVMYVQVIPPGDRRPYEVAVPITSGGRGNLAVGLRGLFYDIDNLPCDARIMQIIENPVSLLEAIVQPFKRLWALITGKLESLTTQAERKLDTQATGMLNEVAPGDETKDEATEQAPQRRRSMPSGGLVAGIGVAVAALGSSLAYITKTLAETSTLAKVVAVLVAVGVVAIPAGLTAWIKLRRRDLRSLLEACGWAINVRMRLSRRQRKHFTHRPRYPKGSRTKWW